MNGKSKFKMTLKEAIFLRCSSMWDIEWKRSAFAQRGTTGNVVLSSSAIRIHRRIELLCASIARSSERKRSSTTISKARHWSIWYGLECQNLVFLLFCSPSLVGKVNFQMRTLPFVVFRLFFEMLKVYTSKKFSQVQ